MRLPGRKIPQERTDLQYAIFLADDFLKHGTHEFMLFARMTQEQDIFKQKRLAVQRRDHIHFRSRSMDDDLAQMIGLGPTPKVTGRMQQ